MEVRPIVVLTIEGRIGISFRLSESYVWRAEAQVSPLEPRADRRPSADPPPPQRLRRCRQPQGMTGAVTRPPPAQRSDVASAPFDEPTTANGLPAHAGSGPATPPTPSPPGYTPTRRRTPRRLLLRHGSNLVSEVRSLQEPRAVHFVGGARRAQAPVGRSPLPDGLTAVLSPNRCPAAGLVRQGPSCVPSKPQGGRFDTRSRSSGTDKLRETESGYCHDH